MNCVGIKTPSYCKTFIQTNKSARLLLNKWLLIKCLPQGLLGFDFDCVTFSTLITPCVFSTVGGINLVTKNKFKCFILSVFKVMFSAPLKGL